MDLIYKRKSLVDKYLNRRGNKKIFDFLFIDVNMLAIYIRLDYNKKVSTYRVNWINLTQMTNNDIKYWLNTNLIYPDKAELFKSLLFESLKYSEYVDNDDINSSITINSFLNYNRVTLNFKRYIPESANSLRDALFIIFDGMAKYMNQIYQVITQKQIVPSKNNIFVMEEDKYDNLFSEENKLLGQKMFDNNYVTLSERINDSFVGVISTDQNYLSVIQRNNDTKETFMSCTCDEGAFCSHLYALDLARKKKVINKFYKIAYVDDNKSMLDNLRNFDYFLCAGIYNDCFVIIDNNDFKFVKILENNKLNFKIVEDDKDKNLEHELKEFLDKNLK